MLFLTAVQYLTDESSVMRVLLPYFLSSVHNTVPYHEQFVDVGGMRDRIENKINGTVPVLIIIVINYS